ncbi:N-acyl homoserine lactonase family protein [Paenibacillus hamazuiensis]|uniref:N-acyl homoserine lactonase family protein n=1 Tax=Paenibacillus hamazuiensis TaxID=2936508 RepID=UPI00200F504D|nr:N-acyl homoserine lactonase family protein [Paenibacillus hamazuiensis]
MNKQIKVHVMHCGDVLVDRRLAYRDEGFGHVPKLGERSEEHHIWTPVSCYLIEHPAGRVVIDAGWSEEVRSDPEGHLGYAYHYCRPRLPSGQSVRERLASRGLTAEDIRYVVISHLDVDHISGLRMLAGAQSIMVSEPEWQAATFQKKRCEGILIEPFALEPIPFGPYGLGKDLFGDGTVYLVFTPGHTAGLLSALVKTEKGWLLLASDAGYSAVSWNEEVLPGHMSDEKMCRDTFRWIREFSGRDDCAAAIANHDPAVRFGDYPGN